MEGRLQDRDGRVWVNERYQEGVEGLDVEEVEELLISRPLDQSEDSLESCPQTGLLVSLHSVGSGAEAAHTTAEGLEPAGEDSLETGGLHRHS